MVRGVLGELGPIPGQLRLDEEALARESLDGLAHHAVRLVVVRGVDVRHAALEGRVDQAGEAGLPEIALHLAIVAAGADPEAAEAHARLAERHLVGCRPRSRPRAVRRPEADRERRG